MTIVADPFAAPRKEDTFGIRRDRYGRYMMPAPPSDEAPVGGVSDRPYTRATTMAKKISDTYALNKWSERMVAKGLALRPDLRALAASTPMDEKQTLDKIVEDAKAAAGVKVAANLGSAMHALTERHDRGLPLPPLEPGEQADLDAYRSALATAGITVLPSMIERTVAVPRYNVAGTFDRIVRMPDGTLRIADLKTGGDLSYGWGEIAIQLAIYQMAEWIYDYSTGQWLAMPVCSPDLGLVIHLPVGKGEATLYDVNLKAGREGLELAHRVEAWRKGTRNMSMPHRIVVDDVTDDVPASPLERVMTATSKAELATLWDELHPQGLWTDEMMSAAQALLRTFTQT